MTPTPVSRRRFLQRSAAATLALAAVPGSVAAAAGRKMTISLAPGSIGVSANQAETVRLAQRHGFESVEAFGGELARLAEADLKALQADMASKQLVFGAAGLPVDFRGEESRFQEGMKDLPRVAAGLQRAGVERVGTWLTPAHGSLTYLQNFRQHAHRLRAVATVLKDHGQRLGLEYVGPVTSRARRKHAFVHSLAETRELIAEIGTGNVGVVLDSWHWYTAQDTEAELLALTARDVVSVDLNDAPAGRPVDEQLDNQRELPMATGVIDVRTFLRALRQIGYDGPVRAEPFNQVLNALDNDAACAATITAMHQAFALLDTP